MTKAIAIFFVGLLAFQQQVPSQQLQDLKPGQQVPGMKAPPGYQTTVKSVTSTYNFYPINRKLPLPFDQLSMPTAKFPKGVSVTQNFTCPSKRASTLYNNPSKTMASFGKPAKQSFQNFTGKGHDGIALFFEYKHVLPADAREQLSKYFFGGPTPPDPTNSTAVEQFLVTDHTLIVWCFKNRASEAKQEHQKYIFELVSAVGQSMQSKK